MNALELPEAWRTRALVLRDVEITRGWFTRDELEEADAFRLPKRREEWMRARIAAKQLALDRGLARDPRDVRVTRDVFSLSHSGPYAAASLGGGIDVQVVREISESAAHLFLSEEETEQMRACTLDHRLLHFWCAKEAAWKAEGGRITTLKQVPLTLIDVERSALRFQHGQTIAIDDVIIALT
jgi:4'-phosphopantetheinyl transferase EntD